VRTAPWRAWIARIISDPRSTEPLLRALDFAHWARGFVDELESALLHLGALPSRRDVRQLFHRTADLARRVSRLGAAVIELEEELRGLERDRQERARPEDAISPASDGS
jgi:hypothetical protein